MILSLIAAASENNVIGKDGKLPWSLPDDLRHFHDLTLGHPVIMGRKTYESIPHDRRPLRDRLNIILTHREAVQFPGCIVVSSFPDAIRVAEETGVPEALVMGGEQVYRLALPVARRVYLTLVHAHIEGDAYFPAIDPLQWKEVSREEHLSDARHTYPFTFLTYERDLPRIRSPHPSRAH